MLEKMLKCDPAGEELPALEMAFSVVKGYVEEINRKIDKVMRGSVLFYWLDEVVLEIVCLSFHILDNC